MEQFVVYCPAAGYTFAPDAGAAFARKTNADRFERELRAVGLIAWTERGARDADRAEFRISFSGDAR